MTPDDGSQPSASRDSAGTPAPGSPINPIAQPTPPLIVVRRLVVEPSAIDSARPRFTEPNKIK
jgi:hypothetical protein